jgi:hypothetical protein
MTIPAEPPTKSPVAVAGKEAAPKFDAFHPDMPRIPGVNTAPPRPRDPNANRRTQIIGIIAAVFIVGVAILWWIKSAPRKGAEAPSPEEAVAESSVPAAPVPIPAEPAHRGAMVAATVEELSKPWAAKKFTFVKSFSGESVEAMVIRLPGGGLWAFSLQEPYGKCELEFVTDLSRIETQFRFHAGHPMVVNPCNNAVYDPLKMGSLGDNVWVRGDIVQGGGPRPPISINVEVSGHSILADRIE